MMPMMPVPPHPATAATVIDADLVLDQLVDECHVIQGWLRDIFESAAEAADEDDARDDDSFLAGPDPARSAWTIVMSLLARDLRSLPEPILHRFDTRVRALRRDLDPSQYETDGSSLLCRLLSVAAMKVSADNDDPAAAPDLARSLVSDLHHRLRTCAGCIEWLSGLREGMLIPRITTRDTRLADRAYDEAVLLLRGEW